MLKTYIESHSSSLTAQAGQEQQNKRDEPRARDEDDDVGWRREGCSPGLRNCKGRQGEDTRQGGGEQINAGILGVVLASTGGAHCTV